MSNLKKYWWLGGVILFVILISAVTSWIGKEEPVKPRVIMQVPASAIINNGKASSDLNQDSDNISDHFKDNNSQGQSSTSSEKTELKGKIKEIVNNSGIDVTKLTNDQINNLNKVKVLNLGSIKYNNKTYSYSFDSKGWIELKV